MTKHPMRIAITVALAAAAAYAAASLPDDDSGGQRSADARYADTSARKPPVIMIVMDEFPGDALLGADGKIDAGRFPHFAELAQTGTWYRNASTVHDSTTKAIPAILDSKLPRNDTQPSCVSFRGSLLSRMAGMALVVESWTVEALRYQVPVCASSAKCGKRPASILPSAPRRASPGNSSITIMITGGFLAEVSA